MDDRDQVDDDNLNGGNQRAQPQSSVDDDPFRSALLTDLYELTMCQAYRAEGMRNIAVFELLYRRLPADRGFMIVAGLDDVLNFLESLHFTENDLAYLRSIDELSDDFVDSLRSFRFVGDVYAMAEGTAAFPHEPIIQVVAPIDQAQLVETLVLNQVHFQTIATTKAARCVIAAEGRTVVDFGSRRAHGIDAALKVARATWIAGGDGTSNVIAGRRYNIPVFGTMAHSYIQSHDDERFAFEAFAREFPKTTLLVDTYDTIDGVRKVIELRDRLGDRFNVRAIRLDSGDLVDLARRVRFMLDQAGLHNMRIFASSGFDEHKIARVIREGAPIDGFGVGTKLATSADAPYLDMAYKLVEYAARPRTKLSSSKELIPGRKQVFRQTNERGQLTSDVLGLFGESLPGRPLLEKVMEGGRRLPAARRTLASIRETCARTIQSLPEPLQALHSIRRPYRVTRSETLQSWVESTRAAAAEKSSSRPQNEDQP